MGMRMRIVFISAVTFLIALVVFLSIISVLNADIESFFQISIYQALIVVSIIIIVVLIYSYVSHSILISIKNLNQDYHMNNQKYRMDKVKPFISLLNELDSCLLNLSSENCESTTAKKESADKIQRLYGQIGSAIDFLGLVDETTKRLKKGLDDFCKFISENKSKHGEIDFTIASDHDSYVKFSYELERSIDDIKTVLLFANERHMMSAGFEERQRQRDEHWQQDMVVKKDATRAMSGE